MSIKDYILRYQEHVDGEDSLYRHVEWTQVYDCPVKDLQPGKTVPFKPDKSMSEPSINCVSVNDTEVVLQYYGYSGGGNSDAKTIEIKLNEQNPSWSCYNGGGRYDTDRELKIIKPTEQ